MKNKIISVSFALTFLTFAFAFAAAAQTYNYKKKPLTANGEYVVMDNIHLDKSVNGIDGKLEVLKDVRLNDDVSIMQTKGYAPDLYSEDAKEKEMFEKVPFRPAILRTVDGGGKVIESKPLDCVRAEIKVVKLYSNAKPSYEITCIYTNLAPLDGDEVTFAEITKGRIEWLEAFDKKTGKKVEMEFVWSHRVGWEYDKTAKGTDILRVYTGWTEDAEAYVLYDRFHFDGKRWIRYQVKETDGYWEDEFHFPEIAKFPKVR